MPTPPRFASRSIPLALALALALAGCLGAPAVTSPDANTAASALTLACADPCGVPLTDRDGNAFEPHATGNAMDPDHVIVGSKFSARGLFTFVTRDGGDSWATGGIPAGADAPDDHPFRDASHLGDPVLAVLEDGTVLYAGLVGHSESALVGRTAEGNDVFVARSSDGGVTFPDITVVAEGDGRSVSPPEPAPGASVNWLKHDKEWITVGPDGTILLVWAAIESATPVVGAFDYANTLLYSTSTDAGVTWTPPAAVEMDPKVGAPFPVITATGSWHVALHDWQGGVHVASSHDAGASWDVNRIGDSVHGQPVLHALPDRLLLAYAAPGPGDGVETPVLRESTDDGATWSEPVTLAVPDAPGDAHPALDVTPDGTAIIGWYHHVGDERVEYRAVAVRDGVVGPALTLAAGMDGRANAFGDYVTGVVADAGGASVTWVQPTDTGRTLMHARVTLPP